MYSKPWEKKTRLNSEPISPGLFQVSLSNKKSYLLFEMKSFELKNLFERNLTFKAQFLQEVPLQNYAEWFPCDLMKCRSDSL